MSTRLMLVALVSATALAGACRGSRESDPIPAEVPGSYVYAAKGSALNKFPWEVVARLDLRQDRTYTLTLDKTMNGERDSTETTSGTYGVSGGKLWVNETMDEKGDRSDDAHSLLIRPDSLIGELGWTAQVFLKGLGAPDLVFVKRRSS